MGFSLGDILPSFLIATAPIAVEYLTKPKPIGPGDFDRVDEPSFLSSIFKSDVGKAVVKSGVSAFFGEEEQAVSGPAKIEFADVVTPRGGQTQASRLPVGATNPAVQLAVQRSLNRTNFNPQYQQMYSDAALRRTLQQGRRTVGLSGPTLPSASKAAAATVRVMKDEE